MGRMSMSVSTYEPPVFSAEMASNNTRELAVPRDEPSSEDSEEEEEVDNQEPLLQFRDDVDDPEMRPPSDSFVPPPMSRSESFVTGRDRPPDDSVPPPPEVDHGGGEGRAGVDIHMAEVGDFTREKRQVSASVSLLSKLSRGRTKLATEKMVRPQDKKLSTAILMPRQAKHLIALVDQEISRGLRVVASLIKYLRKVCHLTDAYCSDISKLALDTEKCDRPHSLFYAAVEKVPSVVDEGVQKQRASALRMRELIFEPLELFLPTEEQIRATLIAQEVDVSATVDKYFADARRQRKICLKLFKQLKTMQKEQEKPDILNTEYMAIEGKLRRMIDEKIRKEFHKFGFLEQQALRKRDEYLNIDLPLILSKLQQMEERRMRLLKTCLTQFANCQQDHFGMTGGVVQMMFPRLHEIYQDIDKLDVEADLIALLDSWKRQYGLPPPLPPDQLELPCGLAELDSDAWKVSGGEKYADEDDEDDDDDEPEGGAKKFMAGKLSNLIRGKVSKKKKRFKAGGFDLDLTYITPRIIAMGFPSESVEGIYRNNMTDVQKFLNGRHPKKYRVYNLCAERAYDKSKFHSACRYPFEDHNPCQFVMLQPFCRDVAYWLSASGEHAVAIHCKAGKGRTGMLIACVLLFTAQSPTADAALRHFAVKRTHNKKGVTIPSQQRYVHYLEQCLKHERKGEKLPACRPLSIKRISVFGPLPFAADALFVQLLGHQRNHETARSFFTSKGRVCVVKSAAFNMMIMAPVDGEGIYTVDHDVCVKFKNDNKKLFHFWFNTRFLEPINEPDGGVSYRLFLPKNQLDRACKDKHHELFPENLAVEVLFEPDKSKKGRSPRIVHAIADTLPKQAMTL